MKFVLSLALCFQAFQLMAADEVPPTYAPVRYDDAFDVSQGLSIIGHTPVWESYQFITARDMFGAAEGIGEPGNMVFADNTRPPDNTDFVEFETLTLVPLTGYRVLLSADVYPLWSRVVSVCRLKADLDESGDCETVIDEFDVAVRPVGYQHAPTYVHDGNRTLSKLVLARKFRIEFKRSEFVLAGNVFGTGPRIIEVDAVTITNHHLPSVVLLSPTTGSSYSEGGDVAFSANAEDPDGILRVEYYLGNQSMARSTQGPNYTATFTSAPPGEFQVRAKAIDRLGGETWSTPVTILVESKRPKFRSISLDPAGARILRMESLVPGYQYQLLRTTDFVSWSESPILASDVVMEYTDPDPVPGPAFYKLFRPASQ